MPPLKQLRKFKQKKANPKTRINNPALGCSIEINTFKLNLYYDFHRYSQPFSSVSHSKPHSLEFP